RTWTSLASRFPLNGRPDSSTSQNRRSPATPTGPSITSRGWTTRSDLTGAIEIRATWPVTPLKYARPVLAYEAIRYRTHRVHIRHPERRQPIVPLYVPTGPVGMTTV